MVSDRDYLHLQMHGLLIRCMEERGPLRVYSYGLAGLLRGTEKCGVRGGETSASLTMACDPPQTLDVR